MKVTERCSKVVGVHRLRNDFKKQHFKVTEYLGDVPLGDR